MAKTNFQYEKRQRELAKKKKKEEKLQRKTTSPDGVVVEGEEGADGATVAATDAPATESSPTTN